MTGSLSVHTVYKPQENIGYLKEWLEHHSNIGVDKFYIYDNSYSVFGGLHINQNLDFVTQNRYGYTHQYTIDEAKKIQDEIIKNYSVELVDWMPIDKFGNVTYGYLESMDHLHANKNSGLVAFIDVDEFIIKQENFRQSRILQVKYEDRHHYNSVSEISNGFVINTLKWGSKCIVDMSKFVRPENMHFPRFKFPISKSYFNHYNHNFVGHQWLLDNWQQIDPTWVPLDYKDIYIKMPSLLELSNFR